MFQGINLKSARRPKYSSSKSMIVYPSCTKIEEDEVILEPKEEDKIPFAPVLQKSSSVKLLVSQIENKNLKVDKLEPVPIVNAKETLINKLLNMNKFKTNI